MDFTSKFEFDPDELDQLLDYILNECPHIIFQMINKKDSKSQKNKHSYKSKKLPRFMNDDNVLKNDNHATTTTTPPATTTRFEPQDKFFKNSTNINVAIAFDAKCVCKHGDQADSIDVNKLVIGDIVGAGDDNIAHGLHRTKREDNSKFEAGKGSGIVYDVVNTSINNAYKNDTNNNFIANDNSTLTNKNITENSVANSTNNTNNTINDVNNTITNINDNNKTSNNTSKTITTSSFTNNNKAVINDNRNVNIDIKDDFLNPTATLHRSTATSTAIPLMTTATTSATTTLTALSSTTPPPATTSITSNADILASVSPSPFLSSISSSTPSSPSPFLSSISSSSQSSSSSTTTTSSIPSLSQLTTTTTTFNSFEINEALNLTTNVNSTNSTNSINESVAKITQINVTNREAYKGSINNVIFCDVKPQDDINIKLICLKEIETELETTTADNNSNRGNKNERIIRTRSQDELINEPVLRRQGKSRDKNKIDKHISFEEDKFISDYNDRHVTSRTVSKNSNNITTNTNSNKNLTTTNADVNNTIGTNQLFPFANSGIDATNLKIPIPNPNLEPISNVSTLKDDNADYHFPKNLLRELEEELERLNDVIGEQRDDDVIDKRDEVILVNDGGDYKATGTDRKHEKSKKKFHGDKMTIDRQVPAVTASTTTAAPRVTTTAITAITSNTTEDKVTKKNKSILNSAEKYSDYLKETFAYPYTKGKRAHSANFVHISKLDGPSKSRQHYDNISNKSSSSSEIQDKSSNQQSADSDDDGAGSAIFCGGKREFFKGIKNWDLLQKQSILKGRKKKHSKQQQYNEEVMDSSVETASYENQDSDRSSLLMEEMDEALDRYLQVQNSKNTFDFGKSMSNYDKKLKKKNTDNWYQPHISKSEAQEYLKNKPPGSFVIRNSNSFQRAYGLMLKVEQNLTRAHIEPTKPVAEQAIRNYLIETVSGGVKIRGSTLEPVFSSLKDLVEEHSKVALSLPCKLSIPQNEAKFFEKQPIPTKSNQKPTNVETVPTLNCNVLYLCSESVECLNETAALHKALELMNMKLNKYKDLSGTTVCNLMLSIEGGLTLTDSCRMLFFRRHYPIENVLYAGVNINSQRWAWTDDSNHKTNISKVFGIVTKTPQCPSDNVCHLFAELDHPADDIVNGVMQLLANLENL